MKRLIRRKGNKPVKPKTYTVRTTKPGKRRTPPKGKAGYVVGPNGTEVVLPKVNKAKRL